MNSAIVPITAYPTLQDVANLVRTLVNDDGAGATGTVGEGQIIVDDQTVSVKLLNALNSALEWTYTSMGNVGSPELVADNYVLENLPLVHGINGIGAPDPAVQVSLAYTGFFDGFQWWPNWKLPANMLEPTKLWERLTSSNLPFKEIPQAQDGLPPNWQGNYLGSWEWRGDAIWFNGSLQACDIRIRSRIKLPIFYGNNINFTTTYIPLQGCVNAVAYKTASVLEGSLGDPAAMASRATEADQHLYLLRNSRVRRAQGIQYNRPAYQEGGSTSRGVAFGW